MDKTHAPDRGYGSLSATLLIAFLSLSAIVLFVFNTFDVFYNFRMQQKSIAIEQQLIAQNAANTVKYVIQEKLSILEKAISLGGVAAAGADHQKELLNKLLGTDLSFRQLAIIGFPHQELVKVSRWSQAASGTLMKQAALALSARLPPGQKYVGSVYVDQATSEPLVLLAVPVNNVFGDYKGLLIAELNLIFMWDLMDTIQIGSHGLAYVVDRQGRLLAFRDSSRVLKQENLLRVKEVQEFAEGDILTHKSSADIVKGILGTLVVCNHAHLLMPDWAVIVELPVGEAYNSVFHGFVFSIAAMLLSLFLAIVASIYLSRRITSPIIRLRDATQEIRRGNLFATITVDAKNEIGELADSFNQMVSALKQTTVSRDALLSEIAERNKIEENLRRSEEEFRLTFEHAKDAVLWADIDTGLISKCNKAAEILFEKPGEELIGQNILSLHPPEQSDYYSRFFQKHIDQKGAVDDEAEIITKTGRIIPVQISASVVSLRGKPIIQGIFHNISYYKQAEKDKTILQVQLLQAEKMAAVGQLAGGVAHEINNPMGVILGFAQSIVKGLSPVDPLYLPLTSIEREALRCKQFVADLLTFSRAGTTAKEEADINKTIDETLSMIEAQAKLKSTVIARAYADDLVPVMINKNQIQQVIVNLCNNAMDAMPDGGKITINTKQEAQQIEIIVADTGLGMPEEIQQHIFEPFFTTKSVGQGTGLGLSLCYEIIHKHGGVIEVQSAADFGSVFTIRLPVR
ncbi:PAS domain S-box protein [candidate division FCPU426 bacterium]|nr:PAS domain S-box protein [candidate division FCPU426 bacterium]